MINKETYGGILYYAKMLMSIVVSLMLLYSSMLKLVDFPGMEESFFYWGYSKTFMYIIGAVELLLALGIFIGKTRIISAIGILILMTGALYTHLTNIEYDQLSSAIFLSTLCVLIIGISYLESRG